MKNVHFAIPEIYGESLSYYELLRKNRNLNWVLEGQNEGRNLNNYECKMLSKLVQIFYDMKEIEAKELFFLGGNEAYFYFKNMGVLK